MDVVILYVVGEGRKGGIWLAPHSPLAVSPGRQRIEGEIDEDVDCGS